MPQQRTIDRDSLNNRLSTYCSDLSRALIVVPILNDKITKHVSLYAMVT